MKISKNNVFYRLAWVNYRCDHDKAAQECLTKCDLYMSAWVGFLAIVFVSGTVLSMIWCAVFAYGLYDPVFHDVIIETIKPYMDTYAGHMLLSMVGWGLLWWILVGFGLLVWFFSDVFPNAGLKLQEWRDSCERIEIGD